jgi:hypothetical protein
MGCILQAGGFVEAIPRGWKVRQRLQPRQLPAVKVGSEEVKAAAAVGH